VVIRFGSLDNWQTVSGTEKATIIGAVLWFSFREQSKYIPIIKIYGSPSFLSN
jgi:hypothetical protein